MDDGIGLTTTISAMVYGNEIVNTMPGKEVESRRNGGGVEKGKDGEERGVHSPLCSLVGKKERNN
jgi:hypothetical protein